MKKILLVLSLLSFLLPYSAGAYYATSDNPEAWGDDTIAGFTTTLKTSKTYPNKNIFINLERPDGSKLVFEETTDRNGFAQMNLDGFHAKKAGVYTVTMQFGERNYLSNPNTFRVYPDEVSSSASSVLIDKQMVKAENKDYAVINVVLTDKHGNPIANHQVNVISSRKSDSVSTYGDRDYTNKDGSVMFKVSSREIGVATYSIYDATSKVVLDKRASVLFSGSGNFLQDVGGNENEYLYANVLMAENTPTPNTSPVYMFKLEDLPNEIKKNNVISFSLNAVDSKGATVTNYTGSVHFSASGDNANYVTLPDDYKFSQTDMGKHTFSKVLTFQKTGVYKISVNDLQDPTIEGEITVNVSEISTAPQAPSSLITITNPVSGKYSANVHIISGVSLPGSDVKVFDNNEEIGTASANSIGEFEFTTPPLADGKHIVYAAVVNDKGVILGISEKINIEIDTTPAAIDSVVLMPDKDIAMGSPVSIAIVTELNMTKVSVVIGEELIELEAVEGMPGTYKGSFQAPAKPGAYNVDVYLTDSLNNEISYKNQKTFTVTELSALTPSDVSGVQVFPGNGKATLVWKQAVDAKSIDHYRIYFGTTPQKLVNAVDTFNASTTWYVPKLKNGVEYFFAVKAVNKDGNESVGVSKVASAIPSENITSPESLFPSAFDENGLETDLFEEVETETGPASVVVFMISGLAAGVSMLIRKRKR